MINKLFKQSFKRPIEIRNTGDPQRLTADQDQDQMIPDAHRIERERVCEFATSDMSNGPRLTEGFSRSGFGYYSIGKDKDEARNAVSGFGFAKMSAQRTTSGEGGERLE